jgi:hypothetical protein
MTPGKTKIILTSLLSLSAVCFIVVSATFAWFNFDRTVNNSIVTTSGDLSVTIDAGIAYKYTYHTLGTATDGTVIYNYDDPAGVAKTGITTVPTLTMNKYDPFYLSLNPSLTVQDLYTNIAIKLTYTFKTYSDATVTLSVQKMGSAYTSANEGISGYVDFWSTATDVSASDVTYGGTTYTTEDDRIYYGMKNVEANQTALNFRTDPTATSLTIATNTYPFPTDTTQLQSDGSWTNQITYYLNVDYNTASLASKIESLTADKTVYLDMDYYFQVKAEQAKSA